MSERELPSREELMRRARCLDRGTAAEARAESMRVLQAAAEARAKRLDAVRLPIPGMPRSMMPALLRGVTSVNRQTGAHIGLSFDCADGSVVRLCLAVDDARQLKAFIDCSLDLYRRTNGTNCHSDISVGSPNVDGSPHEGQVV